MTPRNRPAYEQGQAALRQVREIMHTFKPGARCTWKHVLERLPAKLAKTQVCKYMRTVRQEDRAHSYTAPGALHLSINQTHPDAHGTKHRSRSIAARLFNGGGRGAPRTVEKHPVSADRGGQVPDRGPRPAPVDPSSGVRPAPVIDKLDGYRDSVLQFKHPIWEPDAT